MIEQVKAILTESNISEILIIDDAYDKFPKPSEIKDENWNLFVDDIDEESTPLILELLSMDKYDEDLVKNSHNNDSFVGKLWTEKHRLSTRVQKALFEDYINEQNGKISQLKPLVEIFREHLKIGVHCLGQSDDFTQYPTKIVFIDLFFGLTGEDAAIERAISTIKKINAVDLYNPPLVILMSSSPRLVSKRAVFRDDGQLLGCQFRSLEKNLFSDENTFLSEVYDLISSYPDSLKLNSFILAWKRAIDEQRESFLQSIRRLDLTDYADLKRLILDAEGEALGDHLIDVYNTYFHSFLESDRDLLNAGHVLNSLNFESYPSSHFLPTEEIKPILDATIFENAVRMKYENEVKGASHLQLMQLGDVFISKEINEDGGRNTLVVLTQACDLQQGNAKSILLIRGNLKPYSISNYKIPNATRTPIIEYEGSYFVIDWNENWPITWPIESLDELLGATGSYLKIRRFRPQYGLQLQQRFIGNLGRVGTPSSMQATWPVGLSVFYRDSGSNAKPLIDFPISDAIAACIAGRNDNEKLENIIIFPEAVRMICKRILEINPDDMQAAHFAILQTNASNPSFQRMLRGPLKFKSNANNTPQTEALLANVELRSKNPAQVEQRIDKLLVINIVI